MRDSGTSQKNQGRHRNIRKAPRYRFFTFFSIKALKWLFYDAVTDGNPIGDYEGNLTFSDDELKAMEDGALNCL